MRRRCGAWVIYTGADVVYVMCVIYICVIYICVIYMCDIYVCDHNVVYVSAAWLRCMRALRAVLGHRPPLMVAGVRQCRFPKHRMREATGEESHWCTIQ